MSELCRFNGIIIRMHHNEHGRPHFHAVLGGHRATISIDYLEITHGSLPSNSRRLVLEWAAQRQSQLRHAWRLRSRGENPGTIAPLD